MTSKLTCSSPLTKRGGTWAPRILGVIGIALALALGFADSGSCEGCAGMLVFDYEYEGDYDIYRMCIDATGRTQLTDTSSWEIGSNWSPDGARIAFESNRDGDPEIYIMNADGSGTTPKLTDNTAEDGWPAWSPDGTRLAFYSSRDGDAEIYVMTTGGTDVQQLTTNTAPDYEPCWSPDGSKMAFMTRRHDGGYGEIYVMDSDGANKLRLTFRSGEDIMPDWSPDGTKILFASNPTGSNMDLYTMNAADGSNVVRLTTEAGADYYGVWSPEGNQIAFISDRFGNNEIMLMNADGTSQQRLTETPGNEWRLDWVASRAGVPPARDGGSPGRHGGIGGSNHQGVRIGAVVPNPFRESALVTFDLPARCRVRASLYDVHGRLVRRLLNDVEGPGTQLLQWDGASSAGSAEQGVYFCLIETALGSAAVKLNLIR